MQDNPYSNEVRYTLGLMAYHLSAARPRSVRIASHSIEMVKSVIRQLCCEPVCMFVESSEIQAAIADTLGLVVDVIEPGMNAADIGLFPFSLEEGMRPAGEREIVAACYNALSYKSLLYPQSIKGTVFGKLSKLKTAYQVKSVAGLFSPQFILWQALAKLVERWDSPSYFHLEDRAMHRIIETGPMWRLSYIVVITGRKAG